ncbi:G protein-coupled receptor 184 [Amia ocellicauda]|uniref:G protein-coupled receptor 184 n=1 Tax=Amia ocellicauda TaxID=2972642 RepID=UPI0034639F82
MMNNSNDSTYKGCEMNFSHISDVLMSIYIVVFVVGVLANLLTLGPIIQQVRSRNVLGVYLLNLSISDLLYIFTMPLWIYYYHKNHKELGTVACHLAGFFFYSNMYVSIYLLCCISVDRCLAVSYPLQAKGFRRMHYAWLVCLIVVVIVMGLHLIVLMFNKENPSDHERCYETFPLSDSVATFNYARVAFGFLAPLLLLIYCYSRIFREVRQSSLGEKAKLKVKLLSVGVIAIFSFCFAPYHIILLIRTLVFSLLNDSCPFENNVYIYFTTSLAMSSLNSVVDPVLYVLVSNGVKEDTRLMGHRFVCWQKIHLDHRSISTPPLSPVCGFFISQNRTQLDTLT